MKKEADLRSGAEKHLINRTEVEEVFGVSKRFLEIAAMKGGGPPFVRIGRSVRYRSKDIEAWIESRIVDPSGGDSK